MKIFYNNKKVGNNLVTLKRQIKIAKSPVAKDSIIEVRYPKGRIIKYKIVTSSVDTRKKKGVLKINYILV